MPSTLVTIPMVEEILGRSLTPTETARATLDIDAVIEQLEMWCRRKFTSVQVFNEKHIVTVSTGVYSLFLRWGDPLGDVLVSFGSPTATQYPYKAETWRSEFYYRYLSVATTTVFITYTVDTSLVDQYMNTIKDVILTAVIQKLMLPPAVRFRIINSYSVEGLSINWQQTNAMSLEQRRLLDNWTDIDLTVLAPLKRRLIL